MAVLASASDDPWWEVWVLHAKLYPVKDRKRDLLALVAGQTAFEIYVDLG
ncbi:hypothetical protein ACIGXM_31855 [Kitasatospora sp. NPDC052896]